MRVLGPGQGDPQNELGEGLAMTSTQEVVAAFESRKISPEVALMELLIATEDADEVGALVRTLGHRSPRSAILAKLFVEHEAGCRRIAAMLRADVDRPPQGATVAEGVAFCRSLFDWSVGQSENASVALYSLGSAELLRAATDEIVELLAGWDLLDRRATALDIGCGTGRIEEALAPRFGHIHGVDVSTQMVRAAALRCAHLTNVTLSPCSGLDLEPFPSASIDVVLAVDSFPYVVQAGWELACTMFGEAARVLRGGGHLVILNFSYRGDRERDQRDAAILAKDNGLNLIDNGTLPFRLWNGDAYRFQKPA